MRMIVVIIGASTAMTIGTVPAAAYLDPGTGSILLQGILATIAAAGGVVWNYWARIKSFFKRPEHAGKSVTDADES